MPASPRDVSPQDLLACAVEAARAAGDHARANEARRHSVAERFAHDVKLHLDLECQEKAEEVIRTAFPGHSILGEERADREAGEGYRWIVDPIDGTVNFLHGLQLWCSSVAVEKDGKVLAGAVYEPAMGELFTAAADAPALCNGRPIRVSATARAADALVVTGLSKNIDKNLATMEVLEAVSRAVQKARIMGAAAVDICNVACGRADGYIEAGIYLWDVAAGGLIVERAGGRAEVLEDLGGFRYRYLCTNGLLHDELRDVVRSALAPRRG